MAKTKVEKDQNGADVALAQPKGKPVKEAERFSAETYLNWYEIMLRIRRLEEKAGQLYGQQKIRGFCHLYIGQEAVAAGTISALQADDPIITAYRDHGMALARGISSNECMAELYGKATGCTKGKGGSMHFFSKEKKFLADMELWVPKFRWGPVLPLQRSTKATRMWWLVSSATVHRQGALHETFNMAMTWKLPVIFLCENNLYAMGTSVARSSNVIDLKKLGSAYDMPSYDVDGMSCEKVHDAIASAAEHCRSGKGPVFLEVETYRYKGHSMSDPAKYRTKEEVEEYKSKDPIETTLSTMLKKKFVTMAEVEAINQRIMEEVDECVKFAEESPYPDPSEIYTDNYMQQDYPFITD